MVWIRAHVKTDPVPTILLLIRIKVFPQNQRVAKYRYKTIFVFDQMKVPGYWLKLSASARKTQQCCDMKSNTSKLNPVLTKTKWIKPNRRMTYFHYSTDIKTIELLLSLSFMFHCFLTVPFSQRRKGGSVSLLPGWCLDTSWNLQYWVECRKKLRR